LEISTCSTRIHQANFLVSPAINKNDNTLHA
jgi:hypothetical protein